MGNKLSQFDLQAEWSEFVCDYLAKMISPNLSLGSASGFMSTESLVKVFDYNLGSALLTLVSTHGSMTFINGLPLMPHDTGYQLWSVIVCPDKVVYVIVLPPNVKMNKIGRRTRRFREIVRDSHEFDGLNGLNLPMEVRFEGGQQHRKPTK